MADIIPEPGNFSLSAALEADFPAIKALIDETGINPTGLDWRRFTVARSAEGKLIGCGQLKPHGDGTTELASIAVSEAWRKQGVASAVIRKLMTEAPRPLYLTCLSHNGPFYEKFGFRVIKGDELPKYFRRLTQIASLARAVTMLREEMFVMKLD